MRKLLYFIPLLASGLLATQDVRVVGTVRIKTPPDTSIPVTASLSDSANLDAFSRLRTSTTKVLFESTNVETISDTMESSVATNATVVHISTASRVELRTTSDSGSRALFQSHGYILYQPGRSQLALFTGVFGSTQTNNIQRIGLFDDEDGVFFEQRTTGMYAVIRSYVGGSVNTESVVQSSWNIDPMNGSGPSGLTVNWNKAHIFVIDFQWLGVGRVRLGLDLDGVIYYVHEFVHANSVTDVYMLTANLPVRYENVNTGASTATTLNAICSAVLAEGGESEEQGIIFSTSTRAAASTVPTTGLPLIAITPIDNTRNFILPTSVDIISSGNAYWELIYNPTLTGGSYAQVGASSVAANLGAAYTAGSGKVLLSGYIGTAGGAARGLGQAVLPSVRGRFANAIDGTTGDVIALVVYSFSTTVSAQASLEWIERR